MAKEKDPNGSDLFGGDGEDRTLDLLHAKQALSQLSYAPMDDIHYIIRFRFCKALSCWGNGILVWIWIGAQGAAYRTVYL